MEYADVVWVTEQVDTALEEIKAGAPVSKHFNDVREMLIIIEYLNTLLKASITNGN